MLCFFFSHADCFGLFDFDFDDENLPEGAENFKKVATDKRSLADVTAMVKKANNKLQELQVNLIGGWVFFFFDGDIRRFSCCYYFSAASCVRESDYLSDDES